MFPLRSRRPGGHEAGFLWQILLVVPPVVVLSAMAVYSLRQDRTSIEQDARRNAGILAAELAPRVGERLRNDLALAVAARIVEGMTPASGAARPNGARPANAPSAGAASLSPLCGLILDGRIRLPVDYPAVPIPPVWLETLTNEEARLWRLAGSATRQTDLGAVRRAVAALARAPVAVRANAEWFLVRAEANRDDAVQPVQRFVDLAARYPEVLAESGTPLADLALLLALRHSPDGKAPDSLVHAIRTRMLDYPSFMTPALIEDARRLAPGDAAVTRLEMRWRTNERALDLLRRLPVDGALPGEISLESEGEPWVAVIETLAPVQTEAGLTSGATCHVTLVPGSLVERVFQAAVAAAADQVPAYASVSLRLGDTVWRAADAPLDGDGPIELAAAAGHFDLPLLVPSDTLSTFASDLQRIAPLAVPPASALPDGPLRLPVPSSGHAFAIGVNLASSDALYASYRRRFWLAIGLILTATLAALGGLASTWQAFRRQRRLSEMKSNFVSSVSHELRAPIAAVRLMTESLERGAVEGSHRRQEYLKAIGQECRRLSSLVENVLDFSRIDQGRTQYTFEPADVGALVAQTVELMGPFAAERQVALVNAAVARRGDAAVERRVDRQALQQALVNLIDNAIKHSPAGAEVIVGIEREPEGHSGGAETGAPRQAGLRLFVEDHGPGIPAGEQDRIFEPFYRRGSELRRETRGIGIGLSIVKHVAEAHGGRVAVRSSPGAGSRFTIELPPTEEPAPTENPVPTEEPAP